jgi:hypothetical protein
MRKSSKRQIERETRDRIAEKSTTIKYKEKKRK